MFVFIFTFTLHRNEIDAIALDVRLDRRVVHANVVCR